MPAVFTLFPKFYQKLSPDALGALAADVGFNAMDLTVREGYWCEPGNLKTTAPAFVAAMKKAGLQCTLAIVPQTASQLAAQPDVLAILRDVGVTDVRFEHWKDLSSGPRLALAAARRDLERLAPLCEQHRVRGVVQLHHNTLISSASAAWQIIRELPHTAIGVQLDAGNQSREGYEAWSKCVPLIGEYLCAFGVKDSRFVHTPGKGWSQEWTPLEEGITQWPAVAKALVAAKFEGPYDFMPFYHEKDDELRTKALRREVAFLREHLAKAASPAR